MAKHMRNAPIFDKSKVKNSTPAAQNNNPSAPVVAELIQKVGGMKNGNTISLMVCGREVMFTLRTIPAANVERGTLVWNENERQQELLTETSLEDLIPSFVSGGQLNPAFGREVNGLVEVADGSRRRKTAILTGSDYKVLVGEMDEEQMAWFSQVGNYYRQTSAWERGRRYARLLEYKFSGNVSALAASEKVDRKIITRCVNTAKLPVEVIKIFDNPTELSARAGEELYSIYQEHTEDFMNRVADFQVFRDAGQRNATDMILKTLKASGTPAGEPQKQEKEKPMVRNFGTGITARYKGDAIDISLRGVAPEVVRRIESVLEAAQSPGNNMEMDAIFEKLEQKLNHK